MFTAYPTVYTLYTSDKYSAKPDLLQRVEETLKRAKYSQDDIDAVIKSVTVSLSWQVHIAGYEEDVNGGADSDDSDSEDDYLERMQERKAAMNNYEEEFTPTKGGA